MVAAGWDGRAETTFANLSAQGAGKAPWADRIIVSATPTPNIVSPPSKFGGKTSGSVLQDIPLYLDFRDVPAGLHTRYQFARGFVTGKHLKIRPKQRPIARYASPAEYQRHMDQEMYLGTFRPFDAERAVGLYREDHTAPYKPSSRTQACWKYFDLFFQNAAKESFIIDEGDGWRCWAGLKRSYLTQHLNGRRHVGVYGDERTSFILLDNDNHDQHLEIFQAKNRMLIDEFHGENCCHFQFKAGATSGLHLILVYPNWQSLEKLRGQYRERLLKLDQKDPELFERIKRQQELDIEQNGSTKLKTLGELEIYPDVENGIRLPLCHGRLVATDRIMSEIQHRKRAVADVEAYMGWISNPNRKYIDKEVVLKYLEENAKSRCSSITTPTPHPDIYSFCSISETKPSKPKKPPKRKVSWKGNFFRFWLDWWICGDNHGIDLNTLLEITVLAFLERQYSDSEIEDTIMDYVHDLPPEAASCSSRLRDMEFGEIRAVVRRNIKKGFDGQANPKLSHWIFSEIRHNCPWFDPGDRSTWARTWAKMAKSSLKCDWDRVTGAIPFWMEVLKVKEADVVRRFLDGIVNLVIDKEREGRGFGRIYLQEWIRDKCPEIKVGYNAKVQKILKLLDETGIVHRIKKGFRPIGKEKGQCSQWEVGWRAKGLLEPDSSSLITPSPHPDIYSFCSISDSSYETCWVEVLDSGEIVVHPGSEVSCSA